MHRWMSMLNNIGLPQSFHLTYIVEILILTVIIYELLIWVKNTRAWTLLKGIVVVTAFALISYFFHLTTLTWLMSKTAGVLVTVVVIVFQPELRRALEQLGRKNIIFSIFGTSAVIAEEDRRSRDKINSEIVKAVFEMSKVKTGALIVMEKKVILNEYERTGIPIDALISSQLLMNIFEHNILISCLNAHHKQFFLPLFLQVQYVFLNILYNAFEVTYYQAYLKAEA